MIHRLGCPARLVFVSVWTACGSLFGVSALLRGGATTDTDIRLSWPSEVDNPSVPNLVIAPCSAEKPSVLASCDVGYFRSFLTKAGLSRGSMQCLI
jgi:hypothetical protein